MYSYKSAPGVQPSLVKDYVYCPVIAWIRVKYGVTEPPTDSMKMGRENKVESGRGQVRVRGREGTAVIDEIVESREGKVLVERKAFRTKSIHRYLVQALTEYVIASNTITGIKAIKLVVESRERMYTVTDSLVDEARAVLELYKESIENDKPPNPVTSRWKCRYCWYKRFCPYE